jgi:hypothetical protein
MTDRATRVISRMRQLGEAVRGEAMAGLSESQRATLLDLLLHVRGNMCRHAGGAERHPSGAPPHETNNEHGNEVAALERTL